MAEYSKTNLKYSSIILNGSLYKNCKIIEKLLITREIMELLTNYVNQIKVPSQFDNVFSEECVFSYDSPVSFVSSLCGFKFMKYLFLLKIIHFRKLKLDCMLVCRLS